MSDTKYRSPCISVCALGDDDICIGCYRSSVEITDWFMASDEQKREILARARARMEASSSIRLE